MREKINACRLSHFRLPWHSGFKFLIIVSPYIFVSWQLVYTKFDFDTSVSKCLVGYYVIDIGKYCICFSCSWCLHSQGSPRFSLISDDKSFDVTKPCHNRNNNITNMRKPEGPVMSQFSPIHDFTSCYPKNRVNIILPYQLMFCIL